MLLARTGTGVAHCPSSNMRLGSGIARVPEMLRRQVPLGLAVDGSASNDTSDMLGELRACLLLQKLKEQKVPYKVVGSVISVPADKVYDLRLTLASQGLPQGGAAGFELFDKTSFSTTDFVQKLNYRRALQGELGRTIKSLSEVEQCRVHLAVPERSLFMREDDRPKASVLVKLKPGRKLTQGQVQGIVHLVSSSVEGLSPKMSRWSTTRGRCSRPPETIARA